MKQWRTDAHSVQDQSASEDALLASTNHDVGDIRLDHSTILNVAIVLRNVRNTQMYRQIRSEALSRPHGIMLGERAGKLRKDQNVVLKPQLLGVALVGLHLIIHFEVHL